MSLNLMAEQFFSSAWRPGRSEQQVGCIDLWLECFSEPGFRKRAENKRNLDAGRGVVQMMDQMV